MPLSDSGEETGQRSAEIAGGYVTAGEAARDVLASLFTSDGLRFLAGMGGAEVMAGLARSAALAAVGESERTEGHAVLGANGGHGSLQKELSFRELVRPDGLLTD